MLTFGSWLVLAFALALAPSCKRAPGAPSPAEHKPAVAESHKADPTDPASIKSFELNVFTPILKPYCESCHAATFADSNIESAHRNFLQRVGFDRFTDVGQTPVVLKLKQTHNCWEGETKKCVEAMSDAISKWLLDLEANGFKPKPPSYPNATKSVLLSSAVPVKVPIDSTQYVGAGIENATVADPFVQGSDDVDGVITSYAMGKAGTPAVADAGQAQEAQAVTFKVDVKAPGTYQIWARVKTPVAASNGFFARINNANLNFETPVTGSTWKWVQLITEDGPVSLQVDAPGIVPVPILFKAPGAKINFLVLTQKKDEFDGEQFANQYLDIAIDLPIPNAKIIATVWEKTTEEGKRSLGVKELRMESDRPIHVKTIYPLINGLFHMNHGTYTIVDTTAGGRADRKQQIINTGGSTASTWIADVKKDQLSFAFEILEQMP